MRYAGLISKSAAAIALVALGVAAGLSPAEARGGKGAPHGKDTTPPTITCPSGITADATRSSGAWVNFTVTVTDNKDPSPTVTVSPPAWSLFPVGTTTVTVTATDWKSNTSTKSFNVTVLPFSQTVLPPTGVRTYKAYWADDVDGYIYFEWDITVAADGTVSGTGHQTELLMVSGGYTYSWGPLPSGLSGDGVVSGTIASDGSCQLESSATYWLWNYDEYDADWNPVYTQGSASFEGPATVAWDALANLYFSPDPLPAPGYWNYGSWYVQ